ncbi:MAG: TIGR04219 family outer membrane beta-barrel protein [Campylobacteraceae bacterium]|nr:TIGR04219 family outer membrane beta-barrel protein [Campylobacteraceae bacterium]
MRKILLSTLAAAVLTTSAFADFIGFEAGAAYWNSSIDGKIQKGSGSDLDLKNTLGLDDKTSSNYFWAIIEHPIPIIPNLKIERTNFTVDGNAKVTQSFNGKTFSANADSELTLNQTDFKIYYEILDNWVNVDAGFNFKLIDGNLSVGPLVNEDIEIIVPMLYLKGKFDLPFSGLSAEADLNYIAFNGTKMQDIKVGLLYETSIGFGATLGYKMQNIVLDDIKDYDAELNINGVYFGAFYHF